MFSRPSMLEVGWGRRFACPDAAGESPAPPCPKPEVSEAQSTLASQLTPLSYRRAISGTKAHDSPVPSVAAILAQLGALVDQGESLADRAIGIGNGYIDNRAAGQVAQQTGLCTHGRSDAFRELLFDAHELAQQRVVLLGILTPGDGFADVDLLQRPISS